MLMYHSVVIAPYGAKGSQEGATGSCRVEQQNSFCGKCLFKKPLKRNVIDPESQLANKRDPAKQMLNVLSRISAVRRRHAGKRLRQLVKFQLRYVGGS